MGFLGPTDAEWADFVKKNQEWAKQNGYQHGGKQSAKKPSDNSKRKRDEEGDE